MEVSERNISAGGAMAGKSDEQDQTHIYRMAFYHKISSRVEVV
jgi:hypothetical protein